MSLPTYEKLGVFYLGKEYDLNKNETKDDYLLYDAKDLTTHALCVGMTGSGKTGLCLSLLEEAAIDNIPVIAIDPKGDIGNLLLTFPELAPEDFRPWLDENEALRKGMSADDYAKHISSTWKEGLADWEQTPERIQMMRDAVDLSIYTPGSNTGIPLSVLQSMRAPSQALLNDADAFRDRVASAVSSLLALLGIEADPIRSREHILLANILTTAWKAGRDLSIAHLIREIQTPPFSKVGFIDLETFYPQADRFTLAMQLNNLMASPGFEAWMDGEPLNVDQLLMTREGKPRVSIMSIGHLSESERMFFVTLLLNEVLAWVRSQPGTSSLRAILYMDEVYGYFPPTKNPPSKLPMLTLLKQARAFGLGVVLATQNPVDLDYKGLSNMGTWFLGRLQTERDKARVLEGLESAASEQGTHFDKAEMDNMLSSLGKRVFLMNNVHDAGPVVFQTRWALSYLRGPLSRQQITDLMEEKKQALIEKKSTTEESPLQPEQNIAGVTPVRPMIPGGIRERFFSITSPIPQDATVVYCPALLGHTRLHYVDRKSKIDLWLEAAFLMEVNDEVPDHIWDDSQRISEMQLEYDAEPEREACFPEVPAPLANVKQFARWEKEFKSFVYREAHLRLSFSSDPKAYSIAEETESAFRMRLAQTAREMRDQKVEKIKARYASRFQTARDRVLRAQDRLEKEQEQVKGKTFDSMLSIGSTILGALMGRKLASRSNISKATTAMRSTRRVSKEKSDVARAEQYLVEQEDKLRDLEANFEDEVAKIDIPISPEELSLEEYLVRPRKSDISIKEVSLAWLPYAMDASMVGRPEPLFTKFDEV